MKNLILFLLIFLLFAGCTKKNTDRRDKEFLPGSRTIVVDHPAVVVLDDAKRPLRQQPATLEKILAPFSVPVIESDDGSITFVKKNGDRVVLEVQPLQSRYDIILFNTINDPVPCAFKDLLSAADDYFRKQSPVTSSIHSLQPSDTGSHLSYTEPVQQRTPGMTLTSGLKTRVIEIPDSDTNPLNLKQLPGIEWVINRIDTRKALEITFENDLITYANTDRYFTNGITIALQAPWLSNLKLSGLMIPYRKPAHVAYSLRLVQNMYTPTDTRIAPSLSNDRPYASYIYLGYSKLTIDPARNFRFRSEFDFGIIGPYSPGSYLQTAVHETFPTNDKPQGWETQINTDIIINYQLKAEKALVNRNRFMVAAALNAQAGTLYTKAGPGLRVQFGQQEPYFSRKGNTRQAGWQYYAFAEVQSDLVAFDATMQGGVLNPENQFTLKQDEISNLTGSAHAGLRVSYGEYALEVAQHYLSREYKAGLPHKWGRISIQVKL